MLHQLSRLFVSPFLLLLLTLAMAWYGWQWSQNPEQFQTALHQAGEFLTLSR